MIRAARLCSSPIGKETRGNADGFIIGAELYDHLEKVVDRFEDVANKISALVIDHL